MSRFIKALIVAGSAIFMSGCGTAHYFIPPQPMETSEWQISVVWHFDFAQIQTPRSLIFPDLNYWVGLGKKTNLGFGSNFIWPSHLSFARYTYSEPDRYWIAYAHTQPLSPNTNPRLEVGGAYVFGNSATRQTLSIGLGFGSELVYVWPSLPRSPGSVEVKRSRWPILSFRYVASGTDAGISWAHYHGLTKRLVQSSLHNIPVRPDTLLAVSDVDSLSLETLDKNESRSIRLTIWTTTQGELTWSSPRRCPDCFHEPEYEFLRWAGEHYTALYLSDWPDCPDSLRNTSWRTLPIGWFLADLKQLQEAEESGQPITIVRYPEGFIEKVNDINWLKNDHAIGIAVFGYPK
ncbi:MAG: hypothetical protein AB1483_02270 [Candidatus Zixiibacteriota bacterium]